ncbi:MULTISPECIES: acyltransferase [unclassified Curtobacterium]|uniref:acyltransferase family protein n=1 Tax=unclassified Curtobacterium TaxID=257496 RepID=UPI000D8F9A67|nr:MULTISPECIES: acyltransferase [unclassified Curtobacterium]PYY33961.1 hypothetical protein DEI89_09235 [Curtobacterium sp. MCBD17_030]PZE35701.1 hypothetical protein DEJ31_11100 [Curtobacterium sp. MCPF17_031]
MNRPIDKAAPIDPATTVRFTGVQALRFLAAMLVVVSHVPIYVQERLHEDVPRFPVGVAGVAVFFAISGFVAVIVTSRDDVRPGRFLLRRAARIVPLAWAMTTIKLLLVVIDPSSLVRAAVDPWYIVASYLFLPARGADGLVQPLYTVQWTLSHELLFYVVVAGALALRTRPATLVPVVLAVLALLSVARPDPWPAWQFHADPIVLCFVAGMAVGQWTCDRRRGPLVVRLLGALMCWVVVEGISGAPVAHALLLPVATTAILAAVVAETWWRRLVGRRLLLLGDASYALYLTHPVVVPVLIAALTRLPMLADPARWPVVGLLAACGSVLASVAVWKWVDRPLLRLSQRLTQRREPEVTATGGGGILDGAHRDRTG